APAVLDHDDVPVARHRGAIDDDCTPALPAQTYSDAASDDDRRSRIHHAKHDLARSARRVNEWRRVSDDRGGVRAVAADDRRTFAGTEAARASFGNPNSCEQRRLFGHAEKR